MAAARDSGAPTVHDVLQQVRALTPAMRSELFAALNAPVGRDAEEPMLMPPTNPDGVLGGPHPDRPETAEYVSLQQKSTWVHGDIDVSEDNIADLTQEEVAVLKAVLVFFATADGIVQQNLNVNFSAEIQYPDVKYALDEQSRTEAVHAAVYAALLRRVVPSASERAKLVWSPDMADTPETREARKQSVYTAAQAKAEWARRWMSRDHPLAERIIAFACVEGLLFSSSFALLFAIKQKYEGVKNVMPGLMKSNEWIQRDENEHTRYAAQVLYSKYILHKLPPARVHEIVKDAVRAEDAFFRETFPGVQIASANYDTMMQYVRFQANTLCSMLEVPPAYTAAEASNPFDFMARLALVKQPNFFEQKAGAYLTLHTDADAAAAAADADFDF